MNPEETSFRNYVQLGQAVSTVYVLVLDPICEAKFYKHSYGFRPNRNTHHAKSRMETLINRAHLHHCVDVDIKGFFDNVNHAKLLKQTFGLGMKTLRTAWGLYCLNIRCIVSMTSDTDNDFIS